MEDWFRVHAVVAWRSTWAFGAFDGDMGNEMDAMDMIVGTSTYVGNS